MQVGGSFFIFSRSVARVLSFVYICLIGSADKGYFESAKFTKRPFRFSPIMTPSNGGHFFYYFVLTNEISNYIFRSVGSAVQSYFLIQRSRFWVRIPASMPSMDVDQLDRSAALKKPLCDFLQQATS